MIDKIVSDIRNAIENDCYIAALALALTLPDVCGKAEYPNAGNGKRYKNWYSKYVEPDEIPHNFSSDMPYLNAEIVYSLRNCLLHQGTPNIDVEDISTPQCAVDKFRLIISNHNVFLRDAGSSMISYSSNNAITRREITVSIYHLCYILCAAAEKYYSANKAKFSFIQYELEYEDGEQS